MIQIRNTILLAGLCPALALAQLPAFEVATLKVSPPIVGDTININLGQLRNGTLTLSNASLSDCIRFAYGLVSKTQLSGPDWISDKNIRFDIVARSAPNTTRAEAQLMLRTLLAERLKLAMHTEKRELSYLALVPAKNGPKMPAAKTDAPPNTAPQRPGKIFHQAMGMDLLALLISRFTGETVIDRTDLKGAWEVQLEWAPEAIRPPGAALEAVDLPDGPSLYSAIQNQLGLRLLPRKGPVDVWVVDSVEGTPAEN